MTSAPCNAKFSFVSCEDSTRSPPPEVFFFHVYSFFMFTVVSYSEVVKVKDETCSQVVRSRFKIYGVLQRSFGRENWTVLGKHSCSQ